MGYERAMPADVGQLSPGPVPLGLVTESFDSLGSFLAPRRMVPRNRAELESSLSHNRGERWLGVTDADAVIDAIEHGWPGGVRRMAELSDKLKQTTSAQSMRRLLRRGDQGDEFDVHRALAGRHDTAWSRRVRGPRRSNRGVTVMLNASANCRVHSEAMFWRGAAALCLSDLLTEAGYAVTLIATGAVRELAARGREGRYQYAVTIKASHQQVDIEALAAASALAGFFRVAGFRKIAERPYVVNKYFGRPCAIDLTALDCEDPILVEGVLGQEQAQQWLIETVASITERPAQQ